MKKRYHALSSNGQGIFWIIVTCFLVSVMISIVRYLSKEMHVFQIVMMRNFFGLAFFIPSIIKNRSSILRTNNLHLHIARGLTGLCSMLIWFYAITLIPLPEAVSITFIVPVLTTIAAAIFLREKVSNRAWVSLAIGFIGVLIIIRPDFNNFQFAYVLALITTLLWTGSNILVKVMTKTEKLETITFYVLSIALILSIPIASPHLKPISPINLLWLAIMGGVANISHTAMSRAYSKADISVVQPFDFTRLIFISVIAYFAFGETLNIWIVIGSSLIFLSTIYLSKAAKKGKTNLVKKLFRKKPPTTSNQIGIDI
jgi:drug/metabolite transporter (DMT)-like permease